MSHLTSINYSPKSFSNWGHQWWLQSNFVFVYTINHSLRYSHGPIRILDRSHVHRLPGDRSLSSCKDLLNRSCNLRSDPVAGYERHSPRLTEDRQTLLASREENVTNLFVDKLLEKSLSDGDNFFNILCLQWFTLSAQFFLMDQKYKGSTVLQLTGLFFILTNFARQLWRQARHHNNKLHHPL